MPAPKPRSYTSQLVTLDRRWRSRKTCQVYVVRMVHRKDRSVTLQDATKAEAQKFSVTFTDLRRRYQLLP